jgi:capsid portal protein
MKKKTVTRAKRNDMIIRGTKEHPATFVVNRAGKIMPNKPASLWKSTDEMTFNTTYLDPISRIYGNFVYQQPFDMQTLLEGYLHEPYHAACCNIKAAYSAGSNIKIIDSEQEGNGKTDVINPQMKICDDWIHSIGFNKSTMQHVKGLAIDRQIFGGFALAVYRDITGEIQFIERRSPKMVWRVPNTSQAGDENITRETASTSPYVLPGGFIEVRVGSGVGFLGPKIMNYKNFYDDDELKAQQQGALDSGGTREMIYEAKYCPTSTYYGMPDVLSTWESLVHLSLIEDYRGALYNNLAAPAYIVLVSGMVTATDLEDLIAEQISAGQGASNMHGTLVINAPEGATIEMKPVHPIQVDGSFLEQEKTYRVKILTAERVPPAKAGFIESGAMAGQSTSEQYADFLHTIQPEQQIFSKILTDLINDKFPQYNGRYKARVIYSEEYWNQFEVDMLSKAYNDSVITPNEYRASLGMDERDAVAYNMNKNEYNAYTLELQAMARQGAADGTIVTPEEAQASVE